MRYTYKKIYGNVDGRPIFYGGTFYPESGDINECDIDLTPQEVVNRNRDNTMFCNDYIKGFTGDSKESQLGYIGKWTEDIDKNAKIYYIIDGTKIKKFIMAKYDGFSNQNGIQYIVKDSGYMMDCLLEDGDVMFDKYIEAFRYVQDKYKNKIQK